MVIAENQRKNISEYHNSAKEVQLNFDGQTKVDLSINFQQPSGFSSANSKLERQDIDGQKLMVNFVKFSFEIKQPLTNFRSGSSTIAYPSGNSISN